MKSEVLLCQAYSLMSISAPLWQFGNIFKSLLHTMLKIFENVAPKFGMKTLKNCWDFGKN